MTLPRSEIENNKKKRRREIVKVPAKALGKTALKPLRVMTGQSGEFLKKEIEKETAEELFKVLGTLKGGAMKFGQALSVFEASLPEELLAPYKEALTKLQDSAPPIPTRVIFKVLEKEMGENWREILKNFDERPIASASIGQVHLAEYSGTKVAVKIQYPGIKEAIVSDLEEIEKYSKILRIFIGNIDLEPLIRELKRSIIEEVDYKIEENNQQIFYEKFLNDLEIIIPKPFFATEKIIISEFINGMKLSELINSDNNKLKDKAGVMLAKFHFKSPEIAKMIHADPHPGNFLINSEEKLVVLDFGACKKLPNGFPAPLVRMIKYALEKEYDLLYQEFIMEGFIEKDTEIDSKLLLEFLLPLIEPLREEKFKYSKNWLRNESRRIGDPRNPVGKLGLKLNLPPEYLLIHRVTLGTTNILAQLGSEGRYREEAKLWFKELNN